jgi:hypothetical protein
VRTIEWRQRRPHRDPEIEEIMSALDDVVAELGDLEASESTFERAVTATLTDLEAEIAVLQAAGTDTAALEAIQTRLQVIVEAQAAATAAAQAADPGAQPAPAPTPVLDPASQLPLYVVAEGAVVDTTAWTAVTDVTGDAGETLYTFNADTVGQPPTGVGGDWSLFQGTPTPV